MQVIILVAILALSPLHILNAEPPATPKESGTQETGERDNDQIDILKALDPKIVAPAATAGFYFFSAPRKDIEKILPRFGYTPRNARVEATRIKTFSRKTLTPGILAAVAVGEGVAAFYEIDQSGSKPQVKKLSPSSTPPVLTGDLRPSATQAVTSPAAPLKAASPSESQPAQNPLAHTDHGNIPRVTPDTEAIFLASVLSPEPHWYLRRWVVSSAVGVLTFAFWCFYIRPRSSDRRARG